MAGVGATHSLFLDHLGYVWSCGSNIDGELGVGEQVYGSSKRGTSYFKMMI